MKNLTANWKTTVMGIIAIALVVLHFLYPAVITTAVTTDIGVLLGGLGLVAAKDGNVTGIGAQATTIESAAIPLITDLTANSTNETLQKIHDVAVAIKAGQDATAILSPAPQPPVTVIVHNNAPAPTADIPLVTEPSSSGTSAA